MTDGAADVVLVNGVVHTVDPSLPRASAVAVRGGSIVAVGGDGAVRDLRGPRTETIDLRGRTVLPGFQDAHAHPSGAGLERSKCDLSELHDRQAYLARISGYAAANPDVAWISGGGWAMDLFPGGVPTKDDLDRVVPDRPVFLPSRDHHSAWVNSKALELAGIDAATVDPVDGRIERDTAGEPVGALQEGAMDLVQRLVPPDTLEAVRAGILEGQRYLHALGVTAWQEAIVGGETGDCFDAYLSLDAGGQLTGKVVGALWWERGVGERQLDKLLTRRERAAGCARFRAGTVKFMQDGVCENFTASMLEPYVGAGGLPGHGDGHGDGHGHGGRGKSFFDPEDLKRYVTLVDAHGFQAHFHAIGDRAVREVLDAVEAAVRANGPTDNRHCAAHIQVVHPDDVPRFAEVGLVANGQPLWACNEPQMVDLTLPFLGPERAAWQYPFASLVRAGSRLCFGSDWPVSTPDVMAQIHVAVNRTEPPGHLYGASARDDEPFLPTERIDLETALRAFTMGTAYLNHLDHETGSVTPGKRADLVVLDRDLFAAPLHEIGTVGVDMTFADGELVHGASSG
ncbi:MAG TPA: amidohydrolase [Acidimicrobiales bacterium]|nr:amidohydrolase [Acidimicrobiales bacterium]